MAQAGIRIKDFSGNTVLEITNRITRLTGQNISTGTVNGSYVIPQPDGNDLPWFYVIDNGMTTLNQVPPVVTLSGWTISWTFPGVSAGTTLRAVTICCGAY
jgi:hypothetical protein